MKILFTSVSSMNLEPIVTGLEKTVVNRGHEFYLYRYDEGKEAQFHYEGEVDHNILRRVNQINPDIVIYSGPAEGKCRPETRTFLSIKENAKTICLVCDGGCPNWHPFLQEYKTKEVFNLSINIDGNHDWPKRDQDMTFWGLIDPAYYGKPKKKTNELGFAGGQGSPDRRKAIAELGSAGINITIPTRSETWGTYQEYAEFMLSCKKIINFSKTGSGISHHMKYRVIESGFAHCCLFEQANPVTKRYFEPGVDYIEYKDTDDLIRLLKTTSDDEAWGYGVRLNRKCQKLYTPEKAWQAVFESI